MSVLVPMSAADFQAFKARSVARHAQEQIACGRWPEGVALAHALDAFERLLPRGLDTPAHHLAHITDPRTHAVVGALWFGLTPHGDTLEAFVYDVHVHEAHRRQGHARRAFEAMEAGLRQMGVSQIGLHVFAHNPEAAALYGGLGYGVVSLNLHKVL
jgi:ribosomal protein S18 acetylase RimI-like enzyme